MNRSRAEEIAKDFIKQMNPAVWNGEGKRPDNFDTRIVTYEIGSQYDELDISYELDSESTTWEHYCELRDKETEELIVPQHGYGIDSVLNLADTILDVCQYAS